MDLSRLALASSTSAMPAVPRVLRNEKIFFPFLTLWAELMRAIWRRSASYVSRRRGPAHPFWTAAIL